MRVAPTIESSHPREVSLSQASQLFLAHDRGARTEKRIGAQEILRGVDLHLATGETLVIIGRSGGGKTVLLKHLIGLMRPDAGEIWIDGENIVGLSERELAAIRRKVGILFQGGALFDSMTVEENIAFPLREAGERDQKVIEQKLTRCSR